MTQHPRLSLAASLSAVMQTLHAGSRVVVGWTDASGAPHSALVTMTTGPTV